MSESRKTGLLLFVMVAIVVTVGLIFFSGREPGRRPARVAGEPGGDAAEEAVPVPWELPINERPKDWVVPFPKDANPGTASVAEAIDTSTHPERVTPLFEPETFDLRTFSAQPQRYLNTVEPGRVWQVAQPGDNVPRIASLSSLTQAVDPGESVVLKVKVPAGMPVTFTSFDLGAFENQLTSISVKADAEGIAQAAFTASSGTIGTVNILAASPVTSGQLRYMVYIAEKPDRAISSTAQ